MEFNKYETLLTYGEFEDFELDTYLIGNTDVRQYRLSIEGLIGYESIQDAIDYYGQFLNILKDYIDKNFGALNESDYEDSLTPLYKTRAIEVVFEHNYYWMYLDTYTGFSLGDTYDYLSDVIEQLKGLNSSL